MSCFFLPLLFSLLHTDLSFSSAQLAQRQARRARPASQQPLPAQEGGRGRPGPAARREARADKRKPGNGTARKWQGGGNILINRQYYAKTHTRLNSINAPLQSITPCSLVGICSCFFFFFSLSFPAFVLLPCPPPARAEQSPGRAGGRAGEQETTAAAQWDRAGGNWKGRGHEGRGKTELPRSIVTGRTSKMKYILLTMQKAIPFPRAHCA